MDLRYSLIFFTLGVGYWLDVSIIGRFGINEILAFVCIPFFISQRKKINIPGKPLCLVLAMITLYIVGVLLSDIINDSQALLLYRGLAKPLAIFLSFFIYVFGLAVHPRGLVSFVHGLLIGAIIFFFVGSDFQETTANYNFAVFRYTPIFVSFSAVVGYYIYREVRSPQLIVAFLYLTLTILSAKIMNRSLIH